MKRILVVEDDPDVRENIEEILELSGYQVQTAADGIAGVKIAKEIKPDLILCDIMMPGLDGYGVLYSLSRDYDLATIPFIFLTAKAELEDRRKGMRMGADDFLTKPFDESDLLISIENRLRKNQLFQDQYAAEPSGLTSLIQDANVKSTDEVVANYPIESFDRSYKLYQQGNTARNLYYLHSGTVKTYQEHPDGKELTTSIIEPGNFFGFIPLLMQEAHHTSSSTLSEAEISVIPADQFEHLMANADFRLRILKLLSGNIKEKEQEMLELAYGTVRKRVADGLIRIWEKSGEPEFLTLSRDEIANVIGVATETLIRTLSEFKKEGLLEVERKRIRIKHLDLLKSLRF